eukprot:tig00000402_g201.t1
MLQTFRPSSAHFPGGESYITLPPLYFGNPISFEFWIKLGQQQLGGLAKQAMLFDFANGWFRQAVLMVIKSNIFGAPGPDCNSLYLGLTDRNPSNNYVDPEEDQVHLYSPSNVNGTGQLLLNRWYHAVTTLGATGDLHFYLTDGVTGTRTHIVDGLDPNGGTKNVTILPSGIRNYNYIGRVVAGDPGDSGLYTLENVDLSGFRIWPAALSESEVETLAAGGVIWRQPSLYLPFDDQPAASSASRNVRDASGNGRNGTIVGSVTTSNGAGCTSYSSAQSLPGYRMASRLCRSS